MTIVQRHRAASEALRDGTSMTPSQAGRRGLVALTHQQALHTVTGPAERGPGTLIVARSPACMAWSRRAMSSGVSSDGTGSRS
jgi:hypothetical protein